MKLIAAEYFAGIGLVRMGLEACGWEIAYANDFAVKKYEMYKAFFPNDRHYEINDIFKVNPFTIPITTLATCSFPCIDLSLAGNRNGIVNGKHSSAFWGFIDILQAQGDSTPSIVMVENVPGWLSSNKGDDFRITVQALNKLGYACDVFMLNALRFTPQSRMRVFLIGVKSTSKKNPMGILERSKNLLPDALRKSILANLDLQWFYHDLPEPPPLKKQGLSELVEKLPADDIHWWPNVEVERHLNMMQPSHLQRVMTLAKGNDYSFRTFYRRRRSTGQQAEVRNDDLSGCLRTAIGGSAKQFLIQAGKGEIKMRTMTSREYARLQGVPDEYQITVNGIQALTGFGDAVCVPAITWIGNNYLNPIVSEYFPDEVQIVRFYGGQS